MSIAQGAGAEERERGQGCWARMEAKAITPMEERSDEEATAALDKGAGTADEAMAQQP